MAFKTIDLNFENCMVFRRLLNENYAIDVTLQPPQERNNFSVKPSDKPEAFLFHIVNFLSSETTLHPGLLVLPTNLCSFFIKLCRL